MRISDWSSDVCSSDLEVGRVKDRIAALEEEERRLSDGLDNLLSQLPNAPADDVPEGLDETANVELRRVGEQVRPNSAKEHFELGEALGLMDFGAAAKLSGARFVVLRGALARLERAIGQFRSEEHTSELQTLMRISY